MRFCHLSHSCFFNICYCNWFCLLSIEMPKSSLSLAEFLASVTSHGNEFCHLIMCGLTSISLSLFHWPSLHSIEGPFLGGKQEFPTSPSPHHSYFSVLLSHLLISFPRQAISIFNSTVFPHLCVLPALLWAFWEMATCSKHRTSDETVPSIWLRALTSILFPTLLNLLTRFS